MKSYYWNMVAKRMKADWHRATWIDVGQYVFLITITILGLLMVASCGCKT